MAAAGFVVVASAFVCSTLMLLGTVSALNVNTDEFTVSGLSAGAFMATQMHVAYSSKIKGAGVFAGGPFYCAQDTLATGLSSCMSNPLFLSATKLVAKAKGFAKNGNIDDMSNLAGSKVFLFSGTADTVVKQGVVKAVERFYKEAASNVDVQTEFTLAAEHAMPTDDFGNDCSHLGSPYINNCNYDGAGTMLKHLLGDLKAPTTPDYNNIIKVDQKQAMTTDSVAGLEDSGYAYVPAACRGNNGEACSLHIVFHGCNQNDKNIGTDYTEHTGYDGWAEANNIIMLYPQAKKSVLANPQGCFDWWGYTDGNYAFKNSQQMSTFMKMVDNLKDL